MADTKLKAFEDALAADENLRKQYEEAFNRIVGMDGVESDGEAIQKAAAEVGYDIPLEELERAWASMQEMDEAELDKVAGGWTDEHDHDTECWVAWHCYTVTCHTKTIHTNVNCWKDYRCMFVNHEYGK